MSWVRIDTDFLEHPKLQEIPDKDRPAAVALYIGALSYSADLLTDGFIPDNVLPRIGAVCGLRRARNVARKLQEVGLFESSWEQGRKGFLIHDYLEFQPSKEVVMERRKADRERKRKGQRQQTFRMESERNPSGLHEDSSASVRASRAGEQWQEPKDLRAEGLAVDVAMKVEPTNGLPVETELEKTALLSAIGKDADERTIRVLEGFGMPPAAWAAAREELQRLQGRVDNRAAYAVGLFRSWRSEHRYSTRGVS